MDNIKSNFFFFYIHTTEWVTINRMFKTIEGLYHNVLSDSTIVFMCSLHKKVALF